MVSQKKIDSLSRDLDKNSHFKAIQAQVNARHILYAVHEDEKNFPRFLTHLTEKTDSLAYLSLEIACSYAEQENINRASIYFKKCAELLEHNKVYGAEETKGMDFHLLISALANYCSFQYSKAFVLISKCRYQSKLTQLISSFLGKNIPILEILINEILLKDECQSMHDAYNNIMARALSMVLVFYREGNISQLDKAKSLLQKATNLAVLGDEPAIWWIFRLMKIVLFNVYDSSFWKYLHSNTLFTIEDNGWNDYLIKSGLGSISPNVKVDQYIHSLAFRTPTPIFELFVSQKKSLDKVLDKDGAIVSMPTSSGKTRIAEMVILQTLIEDSDSKVLYLAPFRSLSYEMEESLSYTFKPLGFLVTHLYGGSQFTALDREEMEKARIIIATPEKAKAILRTNDDIISNVKLVIMDEGHLLGSNDREITNEMFTEELRRVAKKNGCRFLVLSAVLPNASQMAKWLAKSETNMVVSDWKPSSQRLGYIIYTQNRIDLQWVNEDVKCFNNGFVQGVGDKKQLIAQTALKLSSMGSVLIYCPRKSMVLSNADVMYQLISGEKDIVWDDDYDWQSYTLICEETEIGKHYLKLARKGILCHSAGLSQELRLATERLLRKNKARFIYATNTLAQGVNLGVSTVIVLGVFLGKDKMTKRDFWNLAGRAGRSFIDTEGKILLVVDCSDKKMIRRRMKLASEYLQNRTVDDATSGVYVLLKWIVEKVQQWNVSFEYFLDLITQNKLARFTDIESGFELIDDSLLALDISYRDSDDDDISWVEEHFRDSLALIQETDSLLRKKYYQIIKARVRAIRLLSNTINCPQLVASGIPFKAFLFFYQQKQYIESLLIEYEESDFSVSAKEYFVYQFDRLVQDISSARIKKVDINILDLIRNQWIEGQNLPTEIQKVEDIVQSYYCYTVPWLLNAVIYLFQDESDNRFKTAIEDISLCIANGLPSVWACRIYQNGIYSRLIASELSFYVKEPNYALDNTEIIDYLQYSMNERKDTQQGSCSEHAKRWVVLVSELKKKNKLATHNIHRVQLTIPPQIEIQDSLYCKKVNGDYYLCSADYGIRIKLKGPVIEKVAPIADVPGISFKKVKGFLEMKNINPFLNIVD